MQNYRVTIIRPLIYVSEQTIYKFAKLYGFARITCHCPIGTHSKRMAVKTLIERIEKTFPNVRKNLAHSSMKYGSQKARKP